MEGMEDKLGALLGNPQLMQQIMTMAQSMNQPHPEPTKEDQAPIFDPALLQKLAGLAGHNQVDGNQQALLSALCPYLSRDRVSKLERAMRAAKLAGFATTLLGSGLLNTGR